MTPGKVEVKTTSFATVAAPASIDPNVCFQITAPVAGFTAASLLASRAA